MLSLLPFFSLLNYVDCSSQSPFFQIPKMGISINFCIHMHSYTPSNTFQTYPRALTLLPPLLWCIGIGLWVSTHHACFQQESNTPLSPSLESHPVGLILLQCPSLGWGAELAPYQRKGNTPTSLKTHNFSPYQRSVFICRWAGWGQRLVIWPFLANPKIHMSSLCSFAVLFRIYHLLFSILRIKLKSLL